ncbi:MAG: 3'(2'),5'-bisphosphate nucleotidase CysQ [Coxiellaceae bacterium]|nr:3'(2'),5'-bisphosphate nucleotidase CysQ [Coxiellaceae bacterium]
MTDLQQWLPTIGEIARQAGIAIMDYYQQDKQTLNPQKKSDQSPVTEADIAAHQVIADGLQQLAPEMPILSEEGDLSRSYAIRQQWQRYWLIDPLDGTRGFIAGLPEFSVNIALIENHQPVMGVIYSPVDQELYSGIKGCDAFKQVHGEDQQLIKTRPMSWQEVIIATGHYHNPKRLAALLANQIKYQRLALNSSLKFCKLAEGAADVYPRFGPTSEWDTAAGQCILEAAGGCVVDLSGESMLYNAKASLENSAFVAIADPTAQQRILTLLKRSLT